MASGFLLKPWFPITCGHNCAGKGTVLERDLESDRAEEQKSSKTKVSKTKQDVKM